jgi:hypothetical protein
MTILNDSGIIKVIRSDGETVGVLSDSQNWKNTISAMVFEETDGSMWQWSETAQSFVPFILVVSST